MYMYVCTYNMYVCLYVYVYAHNCLCHIIFACPCCEGFSNTESAIPLRMLQKGFKASFSGVTFISEVFNYLQCTKSRINPDNMNIGSRK